MGIKKHLVILCMLIAVALLLGACGDQAAPAAPGEPQVETITLRFAVTLPEADPQYQHILMMVNEILERTEGLVFEMFPNGELGSLADTIEMIQQGAPIITVASADFLASYVPDLGAMNGPYLYYCWSEIALLTRSDWFNNLTTQLSEEFRIKTLALNWFSGDRHMLTTNRPIHTVEDLRGLLMRVPGGITYIEMFNALGASPVTLAWSDVYSGLQQGIVDGAEAGLATLYASSLYEVGRYIALTSHVSLVNGIYMNTDVFNSLPVAYQRIIVETAEKFGTIFGEFCVENEAYFRQRLEDRGIIFTEINIAEFAERARAAYDAVPGFSPGIFDTIRNEIENQR